MPDRQEHQQEVIDFLHKHLSLYDWKLSLPHGSGRESYFARGFKRTYFVKVGVETEYYLAMADAGLTPPIFVHGQLENGASVIVQQYVEGRSPSRRDYHERSNDVAHCIRTMHGHAKIRNMLAAPDYCSFKEAGQRALVRLRQKWELYRAEVPDAAKFVDQSLDELSDRVDRFSGEGLVATHGDICNANWLFASKGDIYLLDFESLSMDDPARDLGPLLWWYYPPELRQPFLQAAGAPCNDEFNFRMQVRTAMHCLDILLPREGSFDRFQPEYFDASLRDFRAVMAGGENPAGYSD